MTNIKKPASEIKVGDVIMPPARELSLWMRRWAKDNGISDEGLHMTVVETFEDAPDAKGRWVRICANHSAEWDAGKTPLISSFKARPATPWVVVSRVAE